jgi:O-antigen ligase
MGAALVFTFVLGAWLGTAIAAVMLLVMRFRHGWWLVGAATLVLVAGVALGSGHQHRLTGGKRLLIWQSAISMIRNHPILGIGLDNFQHYYTPAHGDGVSPTAHDQSGRCSLGLGYIQKTHDALTEPCISHPHNLVLDLWLSTGIVGLVAFIALQAVFWSILWRARSVLTLSPVLLGAGGAMLAGLIHGMVDNGYFLVDLSALTWLLFAIASMYATSLPQEPTNGRWWNAFGRRGSGDPANRRSDWVRAVDSGPPGTSL